MSTARAWALDARSWAVALLVGLVVGVGAGVGAAIWLQHDRDAAIEARQRELTATSPLDDRRVDRVESTLADLAVDGVSVSDDGRALIDEAGEQAIVEAVARSSEHVYVVFWAEDQHLGVVEDDAVAMLAAGLAELPGVDRGVLYVWQGPQAGHVADFGADGFGGEISSASDFAGDPAITLTDAIPRIVADDFYDFGDDDGGSDYWGGAGGGTFLGLLIGVGVVLVLRSAAFLLRLVGGPRLPGSWRPRATARPSKRKTKT